VLGPAHLDRLAQPQREAGSVGAGEALVPVGALDEADLLALAQGLRGTAHPQQLTGRVGDRHDRAAVASGLTEHVVEQREDQGQRMGRAMVSHLGLVERDGRLPPLRVDARRGREMPGIGHLCAHAVPTHAFSRHPRPTATQRLAHKLPPREVASDFFGSARLR
jgi:hypothetical protein